MKTDTTGCQKHSPYPTSYCRDCYMSAVAQSITPQDMIDHLQMAKHVTVDEHICDAIIAFIKEHSDARDD
jgi:NPL4 family, putative zinc binding region